MDNFIETNHATRTNIVLALSTGVLFGCSFPPIPLGSLACISLVPLLLLIERLHSFRKQFLYSYLSFFVASCIALYWIGGFTHAKDPFLMMAGSFVLLWEPFFFSVIVLCYLVVRKNFGLNAGLAALPFIWVTFEWLYALGEFAFPWLTLGNTQTYQLEKIQFAELTGIYGISLWLVVMNVLFFFLLMAVLRNNDKKPVKAKLYLAVIIVIVYLLPNLYSLTIDEKQFSGGGLPSLKVGIVQPNVDPWDKWENSKTLAGREQQVEKFLNVTREQKASGAQMSVWPETAILFDLPTVKEECERVKKALDSLDISLTSGYIDYEYYEAGKAPLTSSVIRGSNMHYDSYNAILYLEPRYEQIQTYAKMRLVPFAERIPYAESIPFLIEPLRWGVGISNWGIGKDSTVFEDTNHHSKFLAMVCYESIFPEFVSSFVKRGAEFMVFITNDSWWGNTSGARQHCQYAVLRAVENRRWIVRCANGGISCFIDPLGRIYDKTQMYTEASIVRSIEPRNEQTFYTKHGDWLARIAGIISGFFVAGSFIHFLFFRSTMKRNGHHNDLH
ncbi:MAG: apolipoprotein N-acyltransferase [Bacteroidota bacterium]